MFGGTLNLAQSVNRCGRAEVNGTLKAGGESYQWDEGRGRYVDVAFKTAFGGNWTRLDDDCYTAQNKVENDARARG